MVAVEENPTRDSTPYLVVSSDAHAGPAPELYLRPYCPERHLEAFDAYCREQRKATEELQSFVEDHKAPPEAEGMHPTRKELAFEGLARCIACEGHHDPNVHLRDMDESGIAAEVIFAGGQNFEELPFIGLGWNAGPAGTAPELRLLSGQIWNRWMADYVAPAPHRLLGVMQIPIWDIDAAVREVEWGAEHGLRVANLPAPRSDYPAYTDERYEPFWTACEQAQCTLVTHTGGGETPLGGESPFLYLVETHWLGNRGIPQLIFGGVFERHPDLHFVSTEQRVDFVPATLKLMDSVYDFVTGASNRDDGMVPTLHVAMTEDVDVVKLPRLPSSYWSSNCAVSGSFLAPFEVALRDEVGVKNLLWGSDYPHVEGTWPHTRVAMRHTFSQVPEREARMILGENALGIYHLDEAKLRAVADRIGPTPEQLSEPLAPEEFPLERSGAFRKVGSFS